VRGDCRLASALTVAYAPASDEHQRKGNEMRLLNQVVGLATTFLSSSWLLTAHAAGPVLDQFNGPGASVFGAAPTDNWQQSVTAGMSGILSSISLYSFGGPTTFTVYIDLGLPWHSGANAFETQVTRPWGMEWFNIDVSAANIQLTTGARFTIGVQGEAMLYGSDNTYPGGVLYGRYGDNPPFASTGDLAFATYMIPVPEPSISALSIFALAGLAATRYRNNHRRRTGS
jgi:hypothetical protein